MKKAMEVNPDIWLCEQCQEYIEMDMGKVIKGLELCEIGSGDKCYETACPYYGQGCTEGLKNDILALLKEKEAVEPRRIDGKRNHFIKCGNCNYDLATGHLFCPHCGRSVKWK